MKITPVSPKMKCEGCKPVVGSYNEIWQAPDFHLHKFFDVVKFTPSLPQEWILDPDWSWTVLFFALGGGERKGELG